MGSYWGLYRDNGRENGNYFILLGFIWGFYWCYIGILENKMETAMQGSVYTGFIWST